MKTLTKLTAILAIIYSFTLQAQESRTIDKLLSDWHKAAADIDQEKYFSFLDENAVYIGTDSTEIWTKQEFYDWSKPHFEKQKTWAFRATQRHIYLSDDKKTAWFDELVDFGNGTLRGSGVLQKRGGEWKIMQYVLSVPVPNEKFKSVMDVINGDDSGK